MTDYLELAKSVVAKAATGNLEVEVIITENQSTSIRVSEGEVEQLSQSGSGGMGVRVIDGGKMGYAHTSDLSEESIDQTWKAAVDLCKVVTPDDYRKLPDPEPVPDEDLGIWDESLKDVSVEDKIQLALAMEKATLDYDERIVLTNRATYGDSIGYTYLANSKGFADYYGRTTCFSFLVAIARDEDGGMVNAVDLGASNFFKDLDAIAIGEKAAKKALSLLGGEPVPTQKGTVVLDHFVGAQILAVLSQALSSSSWQRSRSFLKGRMGEEVGSSMVTLMDNGRLKGGMASAPFDGEGVPTKATRLIDEGVLQNLMYDSYSAAKDGVVSTGNAQRPGHQGLPTLGASNFYMQEGTKSPEEIIKGVDKGLYVLTVMQTGGVDPVTGECSMSANGLWIENGELKQSVGGVTIATTLNELLQNISDVGNDLRQMPIFGTIGVPTLRVDNVTIGGVDA